MSVTATKRHQSFVIHEDPVEFSLQHDTDEEEYEADDSILTSNENLVPSKIAECFAYHDLKGGHNGISSSPPVTRASPNAGARNVSMLTSASRHSIVSSLPSSISYDDEDLSPYTPMKDRPHYKHNSPTRAMQMATPPRYESLSPSRTSSYMEGKAYKTSRSDRRHAATRGSRRQDSRSTMHTSRSGTPSRGFAPEAHSSPGRNELPLVLLHVSVIPQSWPYSPESMAAVLPQAIIENQHMLAEKLIPTVLARGLLLSHPQAEYELLEERILEALELEIPRVLKCGHYYDNGLAGEGEMDDNATVTDECPGAVGAHDDSDPFTTPGDHCTTCHNDIALPGRGTGHGDHRWDVKIYAANGLMRAGAWAAAWKEMERVDVEIGPWVPDLLRRRLDQMLGAEEQEVLKLAQEAEEARKLALRSTSSYDIPSESQAPHGQMPTPAIPSRTALSSFEHDSSIAGSIVSRSGKDVSLQILLKNYFVLLARDSRNVALVLMSVLIVFFAIGAGTPSASVAKPGGASGQNMSSPILDLAARTVLGECRPSIVTETKTLTVLVTATNAPAATTSTSGMAIVGNASARQDAAKVDLLDMVT